MEMSEISSVCGACRQVTGPSWLDMSIIIWNMESKVSMSCMSFFQDTCAIYSNCHCREVLCSIDLLVEKSDCIDVSCWDNP